MWLIKLNKTELNLLNSELPDYSFEDGDLELTEEHADDIYDKLIDLEVMYVQDGQDKLATDVAHLADKFFTG